MADCARCQASLAALARTSDVSTEQPSGAPGLGWLFDWRWVAPVATVAVILLAVWIIEPGAPRDGAVAVLDETDLASPDTQARMRNESADRQARRDDVSAVPMPTEETFAASSSPAGPQDAPGEPAADERSRLASRENALLEADTDRGQREELEAVAQQPGGAAVAASGARLQPVDPEPAESAPERQPRSMPWRTGAPRFRKRFRCPTPAPRS